MTCQNWPQVYQGYTQEYNRVIPSRSMDLFLDGYGFDCEEGYSEEEKENLKQDIYTLYERIFKAASCCSSIAVLTAGAPGAGKTRLLWQHREEEKKRGRFFAYICPDDVALKQMSRTYGADLQKTLSLSAAEKSKQLLDLYNKWRSGSTAATHLILAHLIRAQYSFYFGTTAASFHTKPLCELLKEKGYCITFIHLSAPDSVRERSIEERNKTFIQTNGKDFLEKRILLAQNIAQVYLAFADKIEFYFRGHYCENALLAARWQRIEESCDSLKKHKATEKPAASLTILDIASYEKIKQLHNETCEQINRLDLCWEKTVEALHT